MMNTALARLRAKTDRDLAVVIRREVETVRSLALHGHWAEADRRDARVRALLAVARIPAAERERIERMLDGPAAACA